MISIDIPKVKKKESWQSTITEPKCSKHNLKKEFTRLNLSKNKTLYAVVTF